MDIHGRIYRKLYEVRMQDRIPNALYLGNAELLALNDNREFFRHCHMDPRDGRRSTYGGVPIYEVYAPSHLAVGH